MEKIALIIPYFGKFPEWMDLYLYSCSKNSMIDFIFFTDCKLPHRLYSNTLFNKISFYDYCKKVSLALKIPFSPKEPYKLCDVKPFYGIIHQDLLEEYDWWGYGDIDVVYGDLSILVNPYNLNKYDVISTHADLLAGHFTIFRKEKKYLTLALKYNNWKKILLKENNCSFDERGFSNMIKPFRYYVFDKIWYHIIKHFVDSNERQYFYSIMERKLSWMKTKVLLREYCTTPKPQEKQFFMYNPHENSIIYPDSLIRKYNISGGVPYLHFLYFKKNRYWENKQHWENGFYQIPNDFDFSSANKILITNEFIKISN